MRRSQTSNIHPKETNFMNQLDNREADNQFAIEELSAQDAAALADLPVSDEQEAEVKAGTGIRSFYIDETGIASNHNETIAEDEETATASLNDLPVNEEQAEQSKGGIGMLLPAVQKVR